MKNILITGGAGFIGSNLALKLIEKGHSIRILDNLSPQIHGDNPFENSPLFKSIEGKVDFIQGTVTSREDWIRALEGQDAVVHLAAETGTGQSMYEIYRYANVNVGGTALLLDILANTQNSIKKMIVASSRSIYGEGKYKCPSHGDVFPLARHEKDMNNRDFECKCPICGRAVELVPTTEDSKIHPSSVYGITKQNQEQMILTMGSALGVPSVALRYQNVYGPGQSLSNPYTGILSIFSTLMHRNEDINIFEDGLESRDFVFIDDVVNATILALEKSEGDYSTFNVGSGVPVDVKTVTEMLLENYGSESKYSISGNYRIGDIRHNYADISSITEQLGFTPNYSFKEGLRHFTDWVKTQHIGVSGYEASLSEMKAKNLFK